LLDCWIVKLLDCWIVKLLDGQIVGLLINFPSKLKTTELLTQNF